MGLFDTIRNAVGGSDASEAEREESDLIDSSGLDPEDFRERTERLADQNSLDFSIRSLDRLDTLVSNADEETAGEGAAAQTYTETTAKLGSYLGEVLVERYDGRWVREDGWAVTVTGADDDVTVKVFEVAARSLEQGPVFAAVAERLDATLSFPDESDDETSDDPDRPVDPTAETTDANPRSEPDESTGSDAVGAAFPESAPEESDAGPAQTDATTDSLIGEAETDPAVEDAGSSAPDRETDTAGDAMADEGTITDETAGEGTTTNATPDKTDDSDLLADDPTAGDGIRAEYAEIAVDFAEFWSERDLDFTPASLERLDDLVDGEWDASRFADARFGSEASFDDRAFTGLVRELGSYFGELLVRDLDGEWTDGTDHEAAVVVSGPSGRLAVPVFEIATTSLRKRAVFEQSYDTLLVDLGNAEPGSVDE